MSDKGLNKIKNEQSLKICVKDIDDCQQSLKDQINNRIDFLDNIKLSRNEKWDKIVIPNEIEQVEINLKNSNNADCEKNIKPELSINKEIQKLNEELRNLSCMQQFIRKRKNIEHFIAIQKNNIFTIFYEKPIIPKTSNITTMLLEMHMIDGKFDELSLNQAAFIAKIEIELQLNKSGQSWAELNYLFTKAEYRGLGIATTLLATQLAVIEALQVGLEKKGFKKISYLSGLIRNVDNSMERVVLDEIYLKCNMQIKNGYCYYVFK